MSHPRMIRPATIAAAATLMAATTVSAANWPQWRGPQFNGATDEAHAPATFSSTEHVRWSAPMPGPAASTPAVWGDRIFVSSVDSQSGSLVALCLNATTGAPVWRHDAGPGLRQDDKSNYASPSPVTDGKLAWFFFGNGELVALDVATGKPAWSQNIQKEYGQFAVQWTFSSSPMLHGGRLYLQVLQRNRPVNGRGNKDGPNDSYLLAMDPQTGKKLWQHIRPSEAKEESLEAFSTPVPYSWKGRDEILIAGGDCISGHDPATGREFWRWGTWNPTRIGHWRLVPSPVAGDGVALACGPKGAPIVAAKAGLNGTLPDSDLAWTSDGRELTSDVATPLFYQGRFFVLNGEKRTISKVHPLTGKVEWAGDLGSRTKIESSPTAAAGRIYFTDHHGEVFVVSAGDEFKILHRTLLGDDADKDTRSSIPISGGRLFIRTAAKLFCIDDRK